MELYEEKRSTDAIENKSKKMMKIIIIILVLLFLATLAIIGALYYIKGKEFKIYLNQTKVSTSSFSDDTFVIEGDEVYVSIKDFAEKMGYTYNKGEYKYQYSEDETKCYIYNNGETASFSQGSTTLYKVLKNSSSQNDYEYYTLTKAVKRINNKLYTTLDGISKGCNVAISYNSEQNKLTIYTLDYLTKYYAANITDSIFAKQIDARDFSNQKAVLYNLMVVRNSNNKYGVNSLNNQTIIGEKYKTITFLESSQEFIVETDEGKMGIISTDGKTKIEPAYSSIKQIDKDSGLYLVSNGSKYGVVNKTGQIVIYLEYDSIGIDASKFSNDDIKNQYLLYNNCIPVCKERKWGMLDKNGNVLLPVEYDGFGCQMNSGSMTSLLLVPEYNAFVVQKNRQYGLFNSSGNKLIEVAVTNAYSVTELGEKSYYVTYQGMTIDIIDYLTNTMGIKPVNSNTGVSIDNEAANTNNTVSNTTTQGESTTNTVSNNTTSGTVTNSTAGGATNSVVQNTRSTNTTNNTSSVTVSANVLQ